MVPKPPRLIDEGDEVEGELLVREGDTALVRDEDELELEVDEPELNDR